MFKNTFRYLEAAAADGGASGAPGGAPPAAAPAAVTQPAGAPGIPQPASGLGAGATPDAAAPPAGAATPLDWVQAKYIVKDAAGNVDEAASIRKQAEAYGSLVSRMGTDELRPEKATDYKVTAPEGMDPAAFDEYFKDPGTQKFVEAAHAKGFNNSQVQFALEQAIALVPQLEQAATQQLDDATRDYVKKNGIWADDAAFKNGIKTVLGAVDTLAAKTGVNREAFETPLQLADGTTLPPLINDPRVLKILKTIAPELQTGQQPAGSLLPASDIDALMKNPAYLNPALPEHESIKAKVKAHFDSIPNASGKPSGPMVISSAR